MAEHSRIRKINAIPMGTSYCPTLMFSGTLNSRGPGRLNRRISSTATPPALVATLPPMVLTFWLAGSGAAANWAPPVERWTAAGCNPRSRIYRYQAGADFAVHRDIPWRPDGTTRSVLTVLVYLPGDRHAEGLFLSLSVRENLTPLVLDRLSRLGFVSRRREQVFVKRQRLCAGVPDLEDQPFELGTAIFADLLNLELAERLGGTQPKGAWLAFAQRRGRAFPKGDPGPRRSRRRRLRTWRPSLRQVKRTLRRCRR